MSSRWKRSRGHSSRFGRPLRLLFALTALIVPAKIAAATDCPADWPASLPCPQQPWETVGLEHQDRVQRLLRLAQGQLSFEFIEEEISPVEHGIENFPVAIPILRVVAMQDVFFDSGSDVVRREAYRLLDIIAESLKREPPDVSLFIAGHTDWDGSLEYNFGLGLRRANSVATALVRRGIYQASVYRVSFSKLMPIATNETAAGKARNRRVEFLFAAHTQAIVEHLSQQPILPCDDEILKTFGDCRTVIRIPAERVMVSPEYQQQVIDLADAQQRIESDRSLTSIEVEREMQVIETARERIPIHIPHERVEIILDPL